MVSFESPKEVDFTILLQDVLNGFRPVDDLFMHSEFEKWLRIFVYRHSFKCFNETYGPEDLSQDSRQKVFEEKHTLSLANTPNATAFFGWLKIVVFCAYIDELRKYKKPQNNGWERGGDAVEELELPAPDGNYDGKYLLSQFLKFIEIYSASQQRVIVLWLEGCSLRETQEILKSEGIEYSHNTVRNWLQATLGAFKKSLGFETPKAKRRQSGSC